MKNKILAVCLSFLMLFTCFGNITLSAENNANAVDKAQSCIDSIVAYQLKSTSSKDIQEWIDGPLSRNPATLSEWFVLTLTQMGDFDFSKYETALLSYLENNPVRAASSRQKFALTLAAIGSTDSYISEVLNDSIGRLGIMSLVFGLHLLNNGYSSSTHTIDSLIAEILSARKDDGGWAVAGQYGDTDVTAMTVQALAVHCNSNQYVKSAVDKAVDLLASRQTENGDYLNRGLANTETACQVITALSSVGIDCLSDARFIKNGTTLFDVIEKNHLPDGSFSHVSGGVSDANATVEVLYSMVAYLRMINKEPVFYIFEKCDPENVAPAPARPDDNPAPSVPDNDKNDTTDNDNSQTVHPSQPETPSHKNSTLFTVISLGSSVLLLVVAILIIYKIKKRK